MLSAVALVVAATACEKKSPVTPSPGDTAPAGQASTVDAKTGISVTAPVPASPAAGTQFKFQNQPVTIAVSNGVSTGSTASTYLFEVATDAGFANKVLTKDNVAAGASGQTSVTLDALAGAKTYYWHARTNAGSLAGPFSKTSSFAIAQQVILQAPVLLDPAANAKVTTPNPRLTVNNIQRSGPAGPISYKFDLADSSSFANILFTATVGEQANNVTAVAVTRALSNQSNYWWRVQASDPSNNLTTAFSGAFSFQVQLFSMSQAIILNNQPDLASWAETATITFIDTSEFVVVDFDQRTGPGRWPESGFGTGGIQYTLGMCLFINGQWHCSAAIQFWEGRELEAGGLAHEVGINWYYDPARWGSMAHHQPEQGEIVGIFVAQGNLRDFGKTSVKERSNVVLLPFGGSYALAGSSPATLLKKRR